MKKRLMLLGSTGSVGLQSADVARACGYSVTALSANKSTDIAEKQIREFLPTYACMTDENAAIELKKRVSDLPVKVLSGESGLSEMIASADADVAVNSIIGSAGLRPTFEVIDRGMNLALANKESLVIAGDLVMKSAAEKGISLTPVDSEHSAIFQCLRAGHKAEVEKLIITASGGPFFGRKREELMSVTREQALAHPTWSMGPSITVDSATLMNKGFEVIEASKLFGVPADRIDVLVDTSGETGGGSE
ncbi:MAG: 1-deoxy-D-xylulose-5-phosphate reductoisomerase, partial [Clostridia bacterium]|nr:1-deoxy-D-xylulose-5-phosphate reductoisomerase [Clostridia bacterium]